MVVAALFQFYFEHFLPTDDSWPEGFSFHDEDGRVNIEPRRRHDPLYSNEIDQTLAATEMRLVPLSRPGGVFTLRVSERIVDRLQATVVRDNVELINGALPDGLEQQMTNAAIEAVDMVLAHCRVLSDALFVEGVRREYRAEDARYYIVTPHTITWFAGNDFANVAPLGIYPGGVNATASSGAVRAPERGAVPFDELNISIERYGAAPPLELSLLATAQERIAQLFLREAIVAAATACEIASERYVERSGRADDDAVRQVLANRQLSFAERRFDRLPQLLSERSPRADDPDAFGDVQRLYRARNAAAHTGELSYRENNVHVKVDQPIAVDLVTAAHAAVEWVAQLNV